MAELCAAEASGQRMSSQLSTSLLFVVPHLHMNVWVSVPTQVLTLSANHRGGCKDKGKQQLAWWTMVGSQGDRWTAGIDGDTLTQICGKDLHVDTNIWRLLRRIRRRNIPLLFEGV